MDIATIAGIILALVGVLVGMVLKGAPLSALMNVPALLIIIVGTIGAVCIATPMDNLKNIGKLFGVIFGNKKQMQPEEAMNEIIKYAELSRREGLLALEAEESNIANPFMRRAISMINMGFTAESLEDILVEEVTALEERHAANAKIFSQAGTYAPTLGVLGAVIGLIAALGGGADDIENLTHAISAAFMATMFGIFTGYVLWHPFANKLNEKTKIETQVMYVIIKGVVSLLSAENPRMIKESLASFIAEKQRGKLSGGEKK